MYVQTFPNPGLTNVPNFWKLVIMPAVKVSRFEMLFDTNAEVIINFR